MSPPDAWQEAYLRFETPDQERRKFVTRLEKLGAHKWPSDASILELCSGRGNGLVALESLGFTRVEGIDIAHELLALYRGSAICHVADCRALPFRDATKDVVVVHGGLHHLLELPGDLEATVAEVHRVLREGGRFVIVEPWLTPFLRLVHAAANSRTARRAWSKLDALAVMIDHERVTYMQWLTQPGLVRRTIAERFHIEYESTKLGKLSVIARK